MSTETTTNELAHLRHEKAALGYPSEAPRPRILKVHDTLLHLWGEAQAWHDEGTEYLHDDDRDDLVNYASSSVQIGRRYRAAYVRERDERMRLAKRLGEQRRALRRLELEARRRSAEWSHGFHVGCSTEKPKVEVTVNEKQPLSTRLLGWAAIAVVAMMGLDAMGVL